MIGYAPFLGQVQLVTMQQPRLFQARPHLGQERPSWTRAQLSDWVERATAIIEKYPDCHRPIYDTLKAWLAANPNANAVYRYAPDEPNRLNDIFICGGDHERALPLGLKIFWGAVGLAILGGIVYSIAKVDVKRRR